MAKVVNSELMRLEAVVIRAGCNDDVIGRLQQEIKDGSTRLTNLSKEDIEYMGEVLSDNISALGNDPSAPEIKAAYKYLELIIEELEIESQAIKTLVWFEKKSWGSMIVYRLEFPGRPVIFKHGNPHVYEGEGLIPLSKACKGFTKYEKRVIMQMTKDLGGGFYHE